MAHGTVRLQSNGNYWTAVWSDSQGRRRAKGLGPKSRVSKRQAGVLCARIAADMQLNPSRANADRAPKLGEFLERYLASRTDLKEGSLYLCKLTGRYIMECFGTELRIDRITRSMASVWRSALARGEIGCGQACESMAAASVCLHVRNAKAMFNLGVMAHQNGDRATARSWLQRAADAGDTDARTALLSY